MNSYGIWRKRVMKRGDGKCNGPEAEAYLAHKKTDKPQGS